MNRASRHPGLFAYGLLTTLSFAMFFLTLGALLWRSEQLVQFGLAGPMYFIVLVVLGLAAAACLFGIFKTHAAYTGKVLGGRLTLGGPVVLLLLIPILGFTLTPGPSAFAITLFLHEAEHPERPFVQGAVLMRLNGDPREVAVSSKGDADFRNIPANLLGQLVGVQLLNAPGYEAAVNELRLAGAQVSLPVRAIPVVFRGYVRNSAGEPIAEALVSSGAVQTRSAGNGYFELPLAAARPGDRPTLLVQASGYAPWRQNVVPHSSDIDALLDRAP